MESIPIVSVLMITYGHENYIREAIEGVLMQETNFEVELIIANDCSPDKTAEVIQNILKTHPRASIINYIKHEKNIGMMPNFIFAMQQCKGKYIALCEGDDYWTEPLKLQKQVDFLEANKEYVLAFHPVQILKPDGAIVEDFITNVPENYETIETLASLGNYIHTPSVVFRNVIKKFPFEFNLSPIGDYFLYMILAEHGKLKCLEDKMCVYRHGVGVYSGSSHLSRIKNDIIKFGCLLSYSKNEKINKIFLERYLLLTTAFQKNIEKQLQQSEVTESFVNRVFKYLKRNYTHPKKILRKIYFKISKKLNK